MAPIEPLILETVIAIPPELITLLAVMPVPADTMLPFTLIHVLLLVMSPLTYIAVPLKSDVVVILPACIP